MSISLYETAIVISKDLQEDIENIGKEIKESIDSTAIENAKIRRNIIKIVYKIVTHIIDKKYTYNKKEIHQFNAKSLKETENFMSRMALNLYKYSDKINIENQEDKKKITYLISILFMIVHSQVSNLIELQDLFPLCSKKKIDLKEVEKYKAYVSMRIFVIDHEIEHFDTKTSRSSKYKNIELDDLELLREYENTYLEMVDTLLNQ
jgi:hypothetical protein